MLRVLAFIVLAGSTSYGCATLSTMQGAKPVDPGEVSLGAGAALNFNAVPNITPGFPLPLPVLEAAVRYGIAKRMDIGLRARPIGVLADMKFQFLDGETIDGSFAPGLGWGGIVIPGSLGFQEVDVHVPVYFGRQGKTLGYVMGPKVIARYMINSAGGGSEISGVSTRFVLMAGGVVGVHLALGRRFRIGGELNVYNDFTENTGIAAEAGLGMWLDFGGK